MKMITNIKKSSNNPINNSISNPINNSIKNSIKNPISNFQVTPEARKAVLKGVAAVAVLASLAAGILFSGPAEITPEVQQMSIKQPPIVMDIDDYGNATFDEDDEDAAQEKKGGVISRIKTWISSLPTAVRLIIVTPLWAIGTAIITLLTVFGRTLFASPIGAFIISVAVGFAVLTGLFTVTAKALFPEVPLNKILTKEHLATLALASLALAGVDAVAPLIWAKYPFYAALVKLAVGGIVIALLSMRAKRLYNRAQDLLMLA